MLINIQSPVSLSVNHLTDLKKVKAFMDENNKIIEWDARKEEKIAA